ncbi:hypothetical protein GCM10027347_43180 [Larkinella harenae]
MRLIVTLFILVLSISACKKGGSGSEDVDPREQYLGTYDVDYTTTTALAGFPEYGEGSGKASLTFAKGDATNELRMTIEFPGFSAKTEMVKLNGTQFTMNKTRNTMIINGKSYEGEFTGTGLFEGRNVTVSMITKASTAQWNESYKGLKR